MFLWVRLVLDMVDEIASVQQLHALINHLPEDITAAYVTNRETAIAPYALTSPVIIERSRAYNPDQ